MRVCRLGLGLLLIGLTTVPAVAEHLVGIKIVASNVNEQDRTVEADFTVYTDYPENTNYTTASIFWGDGESSSDEATIVVTRGFNVYRGATSHTYTEGDVESTGGDFTIRVVACCRLDGIPSDELVTGRLNTYPASPGRGTPDTVTNTTMVSFEPRSTLEIPTASGVGLLLLSTLLGVGGLVLLRR